MCNIVVKTIIKSHTWEKMNISKEGIEESAVVCTQDSRELALERQNRLTCLVLYNKSSMVQHLTRVWWDHLRYLQRAVIKLDHRRSFSIKRMATPDKAGISPMASHTHKGPIIQLEIEMEIDFQVLWSISKIDSIYPLQAEAEKSKNAQPVLLLVIRLYLLHRVIAPWREDHWLWSLNSSRMVCTSRASMSTKDKEDIHYRSTPKLDNGKVHM